MRHYRGLQRRLRGNNTGMNIGRRRQVCAAKRGPDWCALRALDYTQRKGPDMDDGLFKLEFCKHLRTFLAVHADALSADNIGFVEKLIHQIEFAQQIEEAEPVDALPDRHRFPHA